MSTAQITPGPWGAVKWTCHAATTIKAGDTVVAECSGFGRYADESLADARLIATAPELLEALRELVAAADKAVKARTAGQEQIALMDLVEPASAARRAIAKATGSTS